MSKVEFTYQAAFPLGEDKTEYYLLTSDHVSVGEFEGETILKVAPEALTLLAQQAFHDASFMLRPEHQQQVASILHDPEASENDKYVALQFLRNSEIAAKGVLPTCQDTGTAIIMGKKGQRVWTGGGDEAALSKGVFNTYIEDNLRYSQNAALDMYKEVNTGTNLPAQIDLYSVDGDEYKFLCVAKGGGSANKTYLYQETKALLTPGKLKNFLVEKMRTLGTAACPPYHIAFVIGGTSAESTLKTVKLASTHYYDALPTEGNAHGQAFRDLQLEQELLEEAQKLGLGAQFGGKYFAHDIRVIRLPRHGASCPVGMGVSCSADRNIKAKINREGIWIEKLEHNPGQYIPESLRQEDLLEKRILLTNSVDDFLTLACQLCEEVMEVRPGGSRHTSSAEQARAYIDRHYMDPELSLSSVANAVSVSPNHLSTLFKSKIGVGFSEYLTEVRIRQAKRLLITSDLRVSEVGERVGYQNMEYFSMLFKKNTGQTPSQYRRSHTL